jgi:putative aminopeptidase FrvX
VVGAGVYASHGYERSHIEGLANTFDLLNSYIEIAD